MSFCFCFGRTEQNDFGFGRVLVKRDDLVLVLVEFWFGALVELSADNPQATGAKNIEQRTLTQEVPSHRG